MDASLDATTADAGDAGARVDAIVDASSRDAAPLCAPSGTCSPFVSGACSASETCRPVDDVWACRGRSDAAVAEGATCVQDADCDVGSLCFGSGADAVCRRLCPSGSIGYCGSDMRCTGSFGNDCVKTCRPRSAPCDIYAQDCSDSELSCSFAIDAETGEHYTACRTPGTRGDGETCGGDEGACVRGFVCIASEAGPSVCRQVCDPEGSLSCASTSQTCTGFATSWNTGFCKPIL